LVEEKFGIFLFSSALGGSLGSFLSKINKRKNKQIVVSKNKGKIKRIFFIFL
tara:strand:- start:431 stop:586 length:156 start_codon:yes stop_codon:yes gene_type:complete